MEQLQSYNILYSYTKLKHIKQYICCTYKNQQKEGPSWCLMALNQNYTLRTSIHISIIWWRRLVDKKRNNISPIKFQNSLIIKQDNQGYYRKERNKQHLELLSHN